MKTEKVIDWFKKHWVEITLILGLVALAYGVFIVPSETYPNINEFDPFYHARVIRTLITTGEIPMEDPIAYWPEGMQMRGIYPVSFHYSSALAYWATSLLTTGSLDYNQNLFIKVLSYWVSVWGIIGIVGIYWLGKELRNKKTGMLAAFFLMFSGGFIYRAMYAEAEDDIAGLSAIILMLAAYVWALKRGTWKHGLVAGLFFALLFWTTRFSIYAAAIISLVVFVQAVFYIYNKERAQLVRITEVFIASLVPLVIAIILYLLYVDNFAGITLRMAELMNIVFMLPTAVFLIGTLLYQKNSDGKLFNIEKDKLYKGILGVLAIAVLLLLIFKGGTVWEMTNGLINQATVVQSGKLTQTVAENHPVSFESILSQLNWLALFFVVAVPYLGLRRLIKHKDVHNYDLVAFVYAVTSVSMYLNQGKVGYVFTPVAALVVALVLTDMSSLSEKFGKWGKAGSVALICFLVFTQLAIGLSTAEAYKQQYPIPAGWFKAQEYIKSLPDPDTAFLTWWDYGHWTTFLGEKHAIVDNTNANQSKVIEVSKVFTEWRGSTAEVEEKVKDSMQLWKVTHFGMDRVLLTNKWGALTFLSDRQCIATKDLEAYGLAFPQATEISKNICGYGYTYSGDIGMGQCYPKTINTEAGAETFVECSIIQGAPVQFTMAEWQQIASTPWPGYDLSIGAPDGSIIRMKVYGQPDWKIMFFHVKGQLVYDVPANYMFGLRIFFKDPTLQNFNLVQNEYVPNEEVVIYEVDY